METAFSLLFMAKDFPDIYGGSRGRHRQPGDSQEIEDFLRTTFDVLTFLDQTQGSVNTQYDELARALNGHDTVITLNYDTLLDSALVRRGWDPKHGYRIKGMPRKFKWHPRIENNTLQNVRLLKLHGSLNWFVRGSFSNLWPVFENKPTRIEQPRMNELGGYVRQIVPPIYGKFFAHKHWRELWREAYRALRDAEVVVVVGCSLMETDFHLRALMGRVSRGRKQDKNLIKRLILADRVPIRRRWTRALKGAFVKHKGYKTFLEFIKKEVKP